MINENENVNLHDKKDTIKQLWLFCCLLDTVVTCNCISMLHSYITL